MLFLAEQATLARGCRSREVRRPSMMMMTLSDDDDNEIVWRVVGVCSSRDCCLVEYFANWNQKFAVLRGVALESAARLPGRPRPRASSNLSTADLIGWDGTQRPSSDDPATGASRNNRPAS